MYVTYAGWQPCLPTVHKPTFVPRFNVQQCRCTGRTCTTLAIRGRVFEAIEAGLLRNTSYIINGMPHLRLQEFCPFSSTVKSSQRKTSDHWATLGLTVHCTWHTRTFYLYYLENSTLWPMHLTGFAFTRAHRSRPKSSSVVTNHLCQTLPNTAFSYSVLPLSSYSSCQLSSVDMARYSYRFQYRCSL